MQQGITFNTAPSEIMPRLNTIDFGIKKLVCRDLLWSSASELFIRAAQTAGYVPVGQRRD
jgi:hypothetical protein